MRKLFLLYGLLLALCFASNLRAESYFSEHFCDRAGQAGESHPLPIPFFFEPRKNTILLRFQDVYRVLPSTGYQREYGDLTGFQARVSEDRKSIAVDNGEAQYIFRGCRSKGKTTGIRR